MAGQQQPDGDLPLVWLPAARDEEDEAAWERGAPHTQTLAAGSGHRRRMALLLRLGEKRILRASIRAIVTAFNALNFAPAELDEAD